jgi:hypothetical protein
LRVQIPLAHHPGRVPSVRPAGVELSLKENHRQRKIEADLVSIERYDLIALYPMARFLRKD